MNSLFKMRLAVVFIFLISAYKVNAQQFIIGVGTHLANNGKPIKQTLKLINEAHIENIRDDMYWSHIEREKGDFKIPNIYNKFIDSALSLNINPLIILDYGNKNYDNGEKPLSEDAIKGFSNYENFVSSYFKGKVKIYEIWNEWGGGAGHTNPGTPEEYLNLVKHVYAVIKAVDPSIQVLAGALTTRNINEGWVQKLLKLGIMKYCDGMSLHTYNHCEKDNSPEAWYKWMNGLITSLKNSNLQVPPIYITEMGWPTSMGQCGISVELQGKYIARLFLLAKMIPAIKGIWWYDIQNDGKSLTSRNDNYGLLYNNMTPKLSYDVLKRVKKFIEEDSFIGKINTGLSDVYALRFKDPIFGETIAVWSTTPSLNNKVRLVLKSSDQPQNIRYQRVDSSSVEKSWVRVPGVDKNWDINFTIDTTPLLIYGKIDKANLSK